MSELPRLTVNVVAAVVIRQAGKFLLVQEAEPDVHGLWNWPAGHVDQGETIEQSAIREAKEETGFEVRLIKPVGIWHKSGDKSVKHVYLAEITGGEMNGPTDEILEVKWFTLDEIINMKRQLRNVWVLEAAEMVENGSYLAR